MVTQHPKEADTLTSHSLEREVHRIASWWLNNGIDETFGGFHGEISDQGIPRSGAPKSIILNTRILWFFANAYKAFGNREYFAASKLAYDFIVANFIDSDCGGLYWEVGATGEVTVDRKQTYAQAFGIYAFTAFYDATGDKDALLHALEMFEGLERRAKDPVHGGYLEGFGPDWEPLVDMRLSEVDHNLPKSMNNHLHVLEAYSALLAATQRSDVRAAVAQLLNDFLDRIISSQNSLLLFFRMDWEPVGKTISCGHNIEAAWLLLEAAQTLGDRGLLQRLEPVVLKMAAKCRDEHMMEGRYLVNEIHEDGTIDLSSPWWVQAEALVGFLWMHRLSKDPSYLANARELWEFVQEQHIDTEFGEWLWDARGAPKSEHRDYKAGPWKGPYHNGRAMLEGMRLLREIEASQGGASEPATGQATT